MFVLRQLAVPAMAIVVLGVMAMPVQAARKAFHVTGHLDVVADPLFGPYATTDFDALFVYETELDHPALVDENDLPPATAHAVDATGFSGPPFSALSSSGSSFLFKSYPVPDFHVPDPLGFPDPAGYSGISFVRAHEPGFEPDGMGGYIPEDVVYARSRRGSSERPNGPFRMGVLDGTPGVTPDIIGIVDGIRVTNSNSIAGSLAVESGRFSMFFAHHDGTLLTDTGTGIFPDSGNDLPPTLATPAVISPNGPWGFSAWEGTAAASGSPAIVIEEMMFGDADLDGDVDMDDEAIFLANLDNNRDGLASAAFCCRV